MIENVYQLQEKIQQKSAKVGIVGLGYVGLPNAMYYAAEGYSVCGFEIDATRAQSLKQGISYIEDVSDEEVQQFIEKHQVAETFHYIAEQDVVIIDVPTPITEDKQPDLSYIQRAVSCILPYLHTGQLLILESTSYPGTTRDYLVTPLENEGFTIGEDLFVAFSPERVDPGNTVFEMKNTPKIVGGATEKCTELAQLVIGAQAIPVRSMEVAEMAKVYENTFRFININLANELYAVCAAMEIDPYEVLDASDTKPFGFMKFTPSVKIGGHCIGVDPYYLKWQANRNNVEVPLIDAASLVESQALDYLIKEALLFLSKRPVPLMDARVAILGTAYKKNVSDTRMSAAIDVVKKLEDYQLTIDLYDSHATKLVVDNEERPVISPFHQAIKDYDLVILLTDHDGVDYEKISRENHFFIDTKGVLTAEIGQPKEGIGV
ncbi:hypothetical protein BAU15_00785 [Enterococcus sp. JM4C]|uniref:nucleotide sugar dehydrogenase n=1 Tax=Candidatus Enterococcus huntleyi TaxID=1857217 RepID=UPI00137B8FE5|nr:nucleotide sugar dehydrogenase [Enterococcus sp. JM4C]KAF1299213.1 hypothetical protein BAU15_00785 [Enterococcus sp. JM4C]